MQAALHHVALPLLQPLELEAREVLAQLRRGVEQLRHGRATGAAAQLRRGVGLEQHVAAGAQRLAAERGVALHTQVVDLGDYHLQPDSWDAVVIIFCHLPPALRPRVNREVVAALRPGGHVLLEAYTPAQLGRGTGGPPVAELLYTPAQLREDFAGLALERLEERERDVVEGRLHTGRASVVQLVGHKPA